MKMAIGSTRAGLSLKDDLVAHLTDEGHELTDLGMKVDGPFVPYYEAAAAVAGAVSRGEFERGIIICGTGAGSVIVANKFRGVYAVQASNEYEGRQATVVNNANVLCLGEWITTFQHGCRIIEAWLTAEFGEGFEPEWQEFLHDACDKIRALEGELLK